jgi:uncharacterized membrane protein
MTSNKNSRLHFITKKIVSFFLQGLLYAAPVGITIYVIYFAFDFIDGILKPIIARHINYFPGLGLLLMLVFITLVGFIGQTIVAWPVKALVERMISKAPLLNMVYSSIRDFMEAFVGKEKRFNQPVRVKLSINPEVERLGFITQDDLSDLNIKDKVAVYLPWSYNFSGELYIVPSDSVTPVNIPPGEMMKFIVSGGVTRV